MMAVTPELSRTKDQGSKLDSSTAKQSACNVPVNYEADFDEEPLKSVDISHPAVECSEEERRSSSNSSGDYVRWHA